MTNPAVRTDTSRRRRWLAIVASILVHVLLALVIVHVDPGLIVPVPRAEPTPRETVTIVERMSVSRKPRRIPPPPRARPVPKREPPPARPRVALLPTPVVRPRPPASVVVPRRVAPARHELAKLVPERAPQEAPAAAEHAERPQLSDERLARIERSLGDAIASDRNGRDPLAVTSAPLTEPKHFGLDTSAFTAGDRNHHGLCDPVKDWTEGGYDYYYVACNVRFSDGTVQRQAVPWPVRFKPDDDPFAGTSKSGDKPLAMPLPGWNLPEGETITPELREYARANGVDL